MSWLFKLASAFIAILHVQSVVSAPVYYSEYDHFVDDHAGVVSFSQDFEGLDPFGARVGGGVDQYTFENWVVEAEQPVLKVMDRAYSGNHNTSTDGQQYFSIDTDRSWHGATVHFVSRLPILALGFNMIDHDADDVSVLVNGNEVILPEVNDAEVAFWGFAVNDQPAIHDFWINTGRDSQVSLDDLIYIPQIQSASDSVAVSEPSTLLLLLMGVTGILLRERSARYCFKM